MNIKIIMMLKNEDALTRPWVAWHAALVGAENLILLDNGSTSAATLAALDWARGLGARVDTTFSSANDFRERGEMYVGLIRALDARQFADFWFPLDCDEFLSVGDRTGVDCTKSALLAELGGYLRSPHPLLIAGGLNNNPLRPTRFSWSEQRKTFFAADACDYLDVGFHWGRSRGNLAPLKTRIVYIHFHYKPYNVLIEHTKAKLALYTDDFSREGLIAYGEAKKPGFHLITHLLRDANQYYDSFLSIVDNDRPEIAAAFAAVGERLPFG